MGKYAGREFLGKHGTWLGIGTTEMKYIEKAMETRGFWFIVGAKFHNVLRAFIPYIAGAARMNTSKFWSYNMIGSSIWAVCILLVGVFFIENYEIILKYFAFILIAVILLIIAYLAKFHRAKLMQFFDEKNKELDAKVSKR